MATNLRPGAMEHDTPFLCAVNGSEITIYGLHSVVPTMTVAAARESARRLNEAVARLEFEASTGAPGPTPPRPSRLRHRRYNVPDRLSE